MRRLFTLLTLAALSACDGTPTDPGGVALRTHASEYVATFAGGTGGWTSYGFTIVARFSNPTGRTVYLENCSPDAKGPVFGLELVDPTQDRFGPAYSPFWACVGVDLAHMIAVAPGATRVDTIHVKGPTAVDGGTQQPLGVFYGRMRLVYQVRADADTPVETLGRSNVFVVRRAR